jgi:nucleoid DNA-binding protein
MLLGEKMMDNKTPKSKAKKMTKAAVYKEIAEGTKLTSKQVDSVFEALTSLIKKELGKKGPGEFTIPGLLKLKLAKKPATKERRGPNPFKPGEDMVFKAKPARNQIKARALKTLLESVK